MIEIVPTNTCPPDLAELTRRSETFAPFARVVQLDVADGAFVPAKSWPYQEGQRRELDALAAGPAGLPCSEKISYEIHLMVDEPQDIGETFARAGAKRILGHIETFAGMDEAKTALDIWRAAGAAEAGLVLLLDTPLSVLEPVAEHCDVVQLMSIGKLGYQGAAFEPRIYERIKELHAAHPALVIEIDGGVSENNIVELVRAGATRFGVGSGISKAPDMKSAYQHLLALAQSALQ